MIQEKLLSHFDSRQYRFSLRHVTTFCLGTLGSVREIAARQPLHTIRPLTLALIIAWQSPYKFLVQPFDNRYWRLGSFRFAFTGKDKCWHLSHEKLCSLAPTAVSVVAVLRCNSSTQCSVISNIIEFFSDPQRVLSSLLHIRFKWIRFITLFHDRKHCILKTRQHQHFCFEKISFQIQIISLIPANRQIFSTII